MADGQGPVALSRVRNACRCLAEDIVRFDRDFARFQREARAAAAADATDAEITRAVNEAVTGHPHLQAKLKDFTDRLAEIASAAGITRQGVNRIKRLADR